MPNPVSEDNPFVMVVGPIIWGFYFTAVYAVNSLVCRQGVMMTEWGGATLATWLMLTVTLLALAGLLWLVRLGSIRFWPLRHADDTLHEADPALAMMGRRRFLALATVLLSGLSIVATLYVAVPVLLVEKC